MATERANDPRAFHDFLGAKLSSGSNGLTLEDYLDLWEYENSPEEEREETIRAIERGLDDMHAGRTRPFEEFDREFRARHGLPACLSTSSVSAAGGWSYNESREGDPRHPRFAREGSDGIRG
jgi:hypothetical protein